MEAGEKKKERSRVEKELTTHSTKLKTISLYIAQDLAFWQLWERVQGVGEA